MRGWSALAAGLSAFVATTGVGVAGAAEPTFVIGLAQNVFSANTADWIRGEGWVTRRRRRLVDTAARLIDPQSGELLATAEAVYVAADETQKGELMARYRFRLVEDRDVAGATPS